jgi:hypothetical protein
MQAYVDALEQTARSFAEVVLRCSGRSRSLREPEVGDTGVQVEPAARRGALVLLVTDELLRVPLVKLAPLAG